MRFFSLLSVLAVLIVGTWGERASAQAAAAADTAANPAANAADQIKSSIKLLNDLNVDDFVRILDAFLASKSDHADVVKLKSIVNETKLTQGVRYDNAARQLDWTLTAKQPFKSPAEKADGEKLMRQILGYAHEANQLLVQSPQPGSNQPSDYDVVMGKAQFSIVLPAEPEVIKPIRDYLALANTPAPVNDLTMRVVENGPELGAALAYDKAKRQLSWTLNAQKDYASADDLTKTKGIMRNIVMASYGAVPKADVAIVDGANYQVLVEDAVTPSSDVVYYYYPARRSRLWSFLSRIFDRCCRPTMVCCRSTAIAAAKPCAPQDERPQVAPSAKEKTAAANAISTIIALTGFQAVEPAALPLPPPEPLSQSVVVVEQRRRLEAADIPELKGADAVKRASLSEQWLGAGYHSYWQNRQDEATEYFEKCVAANPKQAAAWAFLTVIELRKGNRELSETYAGELQQVLVGSHGDRSVVNRMLERVQGSLRRDFEALLRNAAISSQLREKRAEVIALR